MSREERKMAQIIASIERMEQRRALPLPRTESSGSAGSSQSQSQSQSDSSARRGEELVEAAATTTTTTASAKRSARSRAMRSKSGRREAKASARAAKRAAAATEKMATAAAAATSVAGEQEQEAERGEWVTPKKKWMQGWSAQMAALAAEDVDEVKDKSDPLRAQEQETVARRDQDVTMTEAVAVAVTDVQASTTTEATAHEPLVATPYESTTTGAVQPTTEAPPGTNNPREQSDQAISISQPETADEQLSEAEPGEITAPPTDTDHSTDTSMRVPVTDARQLRVQTPHTAGAGAAHSHRSPSVDRPGSASISPSSKAKETNESADALTAKPPSGKLPSGAMRVGTESEAPTTTAVASGSASRSAAEAAPSAMGTMVTTVGKRKLVAQPEEKVKQKPKPKHTEPDEIVLTESERRRVERRKRKKSNWDIGDPRHGGSGAPPPLLNRSSSLGAMPKGYGGSYHSFAKGPADGNAYHYYQQQHQQQQQHYYNNHHGNSFARFPRRRPSWRHSSSMDTKEAANGNASYPPHHPPRSRFGGSPPSYGPARRGDFHHAKSLPMERPRSPGARPSPRYPTTNSSSNSNNNSNSSGHSHGTSTGASAAHS